MRLFFMYYVYILYSESADKYYIGSTSSLDGRLLAHNHPLNKGWTRNFQPWIMIYSESFDTKTEALLRERKLKALKSRDAILRLIKRGI